MARRDECRQHRADRCGGRGDGLGPRGRSGVVLRRRRRRGDGRDGPGGRGDRGGVIRHRAGRRGRCGKGRGARRRSSLDRCRGRRSCGAPLGALLGRGGEVGAPSTGGAAGGAVVVAAAAARARPRAAPRIAAAAATPGRTGPGAPSPSDGAGAGWAAAGWGAAGGGAAGCGAAGRLGGPDQTGWVPPSVRSRRRSSLACDICPPTGPGRGAPGPGVATECRGTYPISLEDVGSPRRACRPPPLAARSAMRRWISSRSQADPASESGSCPASASASGASARCGTEPSSGSGVTDGGAPSVNVVTAGSTPASSPGRAGPSARGCGVGSPAARRSRGRCRPARRTRTRTAAAR